MFLFVFLAEENNMNNLKLAISFLLVLIVFSCNAGLNPESDDNSQITANGRDFKMFTNEDIDDTWWEVVKDDHNGFVVDYPIDLPWGWFTLYKPDHWVEDGTVEDFDPDKDGAREWAERHSYYHFKDNKIYSYEKIVVLDEGDVQGEHVNHIWNSLGEPVNSGELYLNTHYDEFEIVDGVIKVTTVEIIDGIYYSEDEDIIYEDYGDRQTYFKKVNVEDIK